MKSVKEINSKWAEFVGGLSNKLKPIDEDVSRDVLCNVFVKYGDNPRHYHNLDHIVHMLDKIDEIIKFSDLLSKKDVYEISLLKAATWYHDIYYEPFNFNVRLSNEFFSAATASREISELLPGVGYYDFIDDVKDLIMITQHHEPNPKLDADTDIQHIFLDADMSILGESPEKYEEYSEQIRDEYLAPGILQSPVFYYQKRKEFLENTLKNKPIFYTMYMKDRYKEQAYKNMHNEIRKLDKLIEEELEVA